MSRKNINAAGAPAAIGPYSHAVDTGIGLIFTSGQIPINPETGEMADNNIKAQTEQVFKNLIAVLKGCGTSLEKVVKATVFLQSMNDFAAMNEVYSKYLGETAPARSAVEVAALPKGALVEIELILLK